MWSENYKNVMMHYNINHLMICLCVIVLSKQSLERKVSSQAYFSQSQTI